jgi:hypothetical protein
VSCIFAEESVEGEAEEGEPMEAGESWSDAFVMAADPAEAGELGEGALDDPAAGKENGAAFGLREFDHEEIDAGLRGLGSGFAAGVGLIDIGEANLSIGGGLNFVGPGANLRAFLFVGRRHFQGEYLAQSVDCDVDLGVFAPFVAVVARPSSAFWGGLGGGSCGSSRHGQPARTIQRSALKTARNGHTRCGASSFIRLRLGAQNSHSWSLTSVG